MTAKENEGEIRTAISDLWYNYPQGDIATMSACFNKKFGCEKSARSGRYCAVCCEKALASLVGDADALVYHNLIVMIRKLEGKMVSDAE